MRERVREKRVYLQLHELDYNHTRCEIQNTGSFKQAYKLHYLVCTKQQASTVPPQHAVRIFFSSHYTTPAQCWAQDLVRGLNSSRSSWVGLHGCGRMWQTSRCSVADSGEGGRGGARPPLGKPKNVTEISWYYPLPPLNRAGFWRPRKNSATTPPPLNRVDLALHTKGAASLGKSWICDWVFHGRFIPTFARCLSILVESPFLHMGFASSSPCPEEI